MESKAPAVGASMEASTCVMHGQLARADWEAPSIHSHYDTKARTTFTGMAAHEFLDSPTTLRKKVKLLAQLLQKSKFTVAYTGAGISTAAGIDCFATHNRETSAAGEARALKDWKQAQPTYSHFAMAALHKAGMIQNWIQQNHDSLPQKAGYPQEALNEIHGSLHDPSNPIVPYEGTLRDDLYEWMMNMQQEADMCLAMGTSLSGFNADSTPMSAAEKFSQGRGKGLVLVNLQHTPMDEYASLRIYARIDTVMDLLVQELGIQDKVGNQPVDFPARIPRSHVAGPDTFLLPVNPASGLMDPSKQTVWNLQVGARVLLLDGPYAGDVGTVMEKNDDGHYRIRFENSVNTTLGMKRRPFSLWLGSWWINTLVNGKTICPNARVPLLNVSEDEFTRICSEKLAVLKPAMSVEKYAKMLRVGVPRPVVEARMRRDGCTVQLPET